MHLGNTTTNMVENAHLSLKRLLQNSLGDICSVWEAMNNMMTLQHTQIKASFETSTHMVEHVFKVALYKKLLGMVSRYALNEIVVEYERVPYAGKNLSRCGCVIRTTHGLSYACELSKYVVGSIPLETTHIFLWRLSFSDQGFCETELDVCGKVHLKTKLREIAYNSMCPPPEKVKTKGAPKKPLIKQQKSTKCDPSYWEYVDVLHSMQNSNSSDSIENIINVKTNDNCDYRAIAALLGIGEESWSLVHNHLHKDFTSWSEDISTCLVYYGYEICHCFTIQHDHCFSFMTTKHDIFPLRSQPPPDSSVHHVICIGHVYENHFVQLSCIEIVCHHVTGFFYETIVLYHHWRCFGIHIAIIRQSNDPPHT
ncbi:hypothetical protein GmHk_12G034473 [Glycine max]|nr:hypothetical protein GmHk_12G034473 [Glycine max]